MKIHSFTRTIDIMTNLTKQYLIFLRDFIAFSMLFVVILFVISFSIINSSGKFKYYASRFSGLNPVSSMSSIATTKWNDFLRLEGDTVEVLFIGSSHCYRTFDTRYFDKYGLKSFNLGTSCQTPLNTYQLLTGINNRLCYKTVIIESLPDLFNTSGAESFVDLIIPFNSVLNNKADALIAIRDRRAFLAYISWLLSLKPPSVEPLKGDTYFEGGYVEKNVAGFSGKLFYQPPFMRTDYQYIYFIKVLDYLMNKNIEIVVVTVPYRLDPVTRYRYQINAGWIAKVCQKRGIPFIDFNEIVEYSPDYFYDASHLNKKGVNAFLPIFYDKMNELGVTAFRSDSIDTQLLNHTNN